MARQGISTGTSPNSGTGDTLLSGGVKINENFSELYTLLGDGTTLAPGIVTSIVAGDNISVGSSTGQVTITGGITTANISAESVVVSGVTTSTGGFSGGGQNITGLSLGQVDGAIGGVTVRSDGFIVGSSGSITDLNFSSADFTASASGAGATITFSTTPSFTSVSLLSNLSAGSSVTASTFYGSGENLTGVVTTLTGADGSGLTGVVTTLTGTDGSGLTGITTLISAGTNITLTTASGITTINSSGGSGITTDNVSTSTLNVVGVSTLIGTVLFGNSSTTTTDYSEVTLSGLSPGSFNTTYLRQTTGFVLDTGTVASGNALFDADSIKYYYVEDGNNGRIVIFSESDNAWMAVLVLGSNFTEGNVSNNQALGSVTGSASVTASSETGDGRDVPQSSGSVVYATSGSGSGVGATITPSGNANFIGVVTASSFVGDGTGLTGLANTHNVSTSTLNVVGVSTLGVVTGATYHGDASNIISGRWVLGANGSDDYTFTGPGGLNATRDPVIYLARGSSYEFVNNMGAHPFQIQTNNGGSAFTTGVTNNGASNGTVRFDVPFDAGNLLWYQCTSHAGMAGTIVVYPNLFTV